jgi:hypothetical protein
MLPLLGTWGGARYADRLEGSRNEWAGSRNIQKAFDSRQEVARRTHLGSALPSTAA